MQPADAPPHPGEVLSNSYMQPMGIGAIALARRIGVPRTRIERLVKGTTGITPDTALRLARVFGTKAEYWLSLQTRYDLARARQNTDLTGIEPVVTAIDVLAENKG